MDERAVHRLLEPIRGKLALLKVDKLMLIGSCARAESTEDSDVDFVVQFEGKPTFLRYMALIDLLEETLGRHVDLTTYSALRPELASDVLAGAKRVA